MQERSLLEYWLILYERRVAIYLVVATAIVSALVVGSQVPPVYEARAALYIPARTVPVSYMAGTSTTSLAREPASPLNKEADYKPYLGILKSTQLAQLVSTKFPQKSTTKLLRSDVDFEVTDELVVRVYSRDRDPKLAADVANAYMDGLNTILASNSLAQMEQEPEYIKSALQRIGREIDKAQLDLKVFEKQHQLVNLDVELATLATQKSALQAKADDARVDLGGVRARKKALTEEIKREGQDLAASEVAVNSPVIQNLRTQLSDAMTRLSDLDFELGGNNEQLAAQRQRKQELEQRLKSEIARVISSRIKPGNSYLEELRQKFIDVVVEEQQLVAVARGTEQSLGRLKTRLAAYPDIKARSAEAKSNLDRLNRMRDQLQINLREAQMQQQRQMQLVVQLDRAVPPRAPAFPIWWLNLFVAVFAGTLVGIGYAFFLNYLKETRGIRTGRLVRAILGPTASEASRGEPL
jgi:uncharacterized protein involved in exopolysaccharide biosynthesis